MIVYVMHDGHILIFNALNHKENPQALEIMPNSHINTMYKSDMVLC